jgi:hypothetical protein
MIAKLIKNFPAFYGTQRLLAVFTRGCFEFVMHFIQFHVLLEYTKFTLFIYLLHLVYIAQYFVQYTPSKY